MIDLEKSPQPNRYGVHGLSARAEELLGILQEECAEVIQIISKIRRFGLESFSPYDPTKKTNLELMRTEIADIMAIVDLIEQEDANLLSTVDLKERAERKKLKVQKFLRT